MLAELASQAFWLGLLKIIGVNIILSGDNAGVIALAARSLPARQQKQAGVWGAGAAGVLRIPLPIFPAALLLPPLVEIIWRPPPFLVGVKPLLPPGGGEKN